MPAAKNPAAASMPPAITDRRDRRASTMSWNGREEDGFDEKSSGSTSSTGGSVVRVMGAPAVSVRVRPRRR
jgi:hypothetical protein